MQAPALRWWSAGAIPAGTAWRRPGGAVFFSAPSTCCSPFCCRPLPRASARCWAWVARSICWRKCPPVLWGLLLVAPTAVAVLDKGAVRRFGPKAASVLYLLFLFACIGGSNLVQAVEGPLAVLPGVGVYRRPGGGRRPWQHLAACTRRWGTNKKKNCTS